MKLNLNMVVLKNGVTTFEREISLSRWWGATTVRLTKFGIFLADVPSKHLKLSIKREGDTARITTKMTRPFSLISGTSYSTVSQKFVMSPTSQFVLDAEGYTLLGQLAPPSIKPKIWRNTQYYGMPLFYNRRDVFPFLLGLFLTTFLCSCFFLGLLGRQGNEASTRLSELTNGYILQFVSPEIFSYAPEVLKFDLQRDRLTQQMIEMYEDIVYLDRPPHFPTIYAALDVREFYKRANQVPFLEMQAGHSVGAHKLVTFVTQNSLEDVAFALLDRLEKMRGSFAYALEKRKSVIVEFEDDPPYDWEQKVADVPFTPRNRNSELSKIKVFDQHTNEETMYIISDQLKAEAAEWRLHDPPRVGFWLTPDTANSLYLSREIGYVAPFAPPHNLPLKPTQSPPMDSRE